MATSRTLIKKHLTRPYLNAGTSDAPQWVQIKKATEFTRSMNPETEERDYIADEQPTTELMQYKPSESLTVTMYFGEDDFNLFYDLYKKRATGDDAKMEYLLVYLYDCREAGGYSYYYAEKTEATVAVDEFNSVDSTMTVTVYENGTPETGYAWLEDGLPVFAEGEMPEAEEAAAVTLSAASLVTVQQAYGTYSLSDSAMADARAAFDAALAASDLIYDASLNTLSMEFAAGQALEVKCGIGYGYEKAHYPRDYDCTIPGKYSFLAGLEEGKVSGIALDYSAMTIDGVYTGGHNDVGSCSADGSCATKRAEGEAVSDGMGTGAGAKLAAIARQAVQQLVQKLNAGLSFADGALALDGETVAAK